MSTRKMRIIIVPVPHSSSPIPRAVPLCSAPPRYSGGMIMLPFLNHQNVGSNRGKRIGTFPSIDALPCGHDQQRPTRPSPLNLCIGEQCWVRHGGASRESSLEEIRRQTRRSLLEQGFLINSPLLVRNGAKHARIFQDFRVAFFDPTKRRIPISLFGRHKVLVEKPGVKPAVAEPW